MFYCDDCGDKNQWPMTFSGSFGPCECCGKVGTCNDVPSRLLPTAKRDEAK